MLIIPKFFVSLVAEKGYFWNDDVLYEHPSPSYKSLDPLCYQPSSEKKKNRVEPAFKAFISLKDTDQETSLAEFVQFANTYGRLIPLSSTNAFKYNLKLPDCDVHEQSFAYWQQEKFFMKYTYDLWSNSQQPQFTWLLIKTNQNTANHILQTPQWRPKDIIPLPDELDALDFALSLVQMGGYFLEVVPTNFLQHFKFPIFQHDIENVPKPVQQLKMIWLSKFLLFNMSDEKTSCEYSLQFDAKTNSWHPFIRPRTLLAAMWYQLSEEISGKKKFKQCKYCDQWQDVTDNNENWDAHPDCANAMRVKNWRKKQKQNLLALAKKDDDK